MVDNREFYQTFVCLVVLANDPRAKLCMNSAQTTVTDNDGDNVHLLQAITPSAF